MTMSKPFQIAGAEKPHRAEAKPEPVASASNIYQNVCTTWLRRRTEDMQIGMEATKHLSECRDITQAAADAPLDPMPQPFPCYNKLEAMPTVSASKTVLKQKLTMEWTRVNRRNPEPLTATSEVWAVMPTVKAK